LQESLETLFKIMQRLSSYFLQFKTFFLLPCYSILFSFKISGNLVKKKKKKIDDGNFKSGRSLEKEEEVAIRLTPVLAIQFYSAANLP
jgi:hypothetical protein